MRQIISNQILISDEIMADSDLETQEKSKEAQNPSFLPFAILTHTDLNEEGGFSLRSFTIFLPRRRMVINLISLPSFARFA